MTKLPSLKYPLLILASAALVAGCVNENGRIRPPDPLGRWIFDALDRPPYPNQRQPQYAGVPDSQVAPYDQRSAPPQGFARPVWVEGGWGQSQGQRVWVPGHWADAQAVYGPAYGH